MFQEISFQINYFNQFNQHSNSDFRFLWNYLVLERYESDVEIFQIWVRSVTVIWIINKQIWFTDYGITYMSVKQRLGSTKANTDTDQSWTQNNIVYDIFIRLVIESTLEKFNLRTSTTNPATLTSLLTKGRQLD